MLKTEPVIEGLTNEICFAYAAAAINGTELRLFLFKEVQQCALFFFSSDNH